jgi:hypothetical protein
MMVRETSPSSRLLKQPASSVLASFRPSTYREGTPGPSLAAALLDRLFEQPAGNVRLSSPS